MLRTLPPTLCVRSADQVTQHTPRLLINREVVGAATPADFLMGPSSGFMFSQPDENTRA
jgi:hypothetical protein